MFKFTLSRGGVAVAAIALLAATQVQAAPTTYAISQGGWSGGGMVTGQFSGEDLNNDGFISLDQGEVSSYQINFSGNATIPAFSHGLSALQFFRYTLGTPGFRPSAPLYSFAAPYMYDADDYTIGLPDLSLVTQTTQNAQVVALGAVQVAVPSLSTYAQYGLMALLMLSSVVVLIRTRSA